jgi:hypothetical protein
MSRWIKVAARCQLIIGLFGLLAAANAATPVSSAYETVLGPTPINHITNVTLTGEGAVIATLSGSTLKIAGTFTGLSGPATDAHVMMGEGIGIPGSPILDLTASPGVNGTISGTFTLNRSQVQALRDGRLYVQVNSQKGPAPDGNLWGWLLPEHVKAGQDEPLMGSWFLPQGEGLRASRNSGRNF